MLKVITASIMAMFMISCVSNGVPPNKTETGMSEKTLTRIMGNATVKLVAKAGGSGSGVILRSTAKRGSFILTNMHVCQALQSSQGFVLHDNRTIAVSHYKISKIHDMCLVRVREHLGVNTGVASRAPKKFDMVYNSGHPNGEPLSLAKGRVTDRVTIAIAYAYVPCQSIDEHPDCAMYGDKPLVSHMDSLYASFMSAPGSSGSGVFNSQGKLVGLVFAGYGMSYSYSYNVPYEYIHEFLTQEQYKLKWERHKSSTSHHSQSIKMLIKPEVMGIVR